MTLAIRVENLGKTYRVGHKPQLGDYRTLRETVSGAASGLINRLRGRGAREQVEDFWALRDVSFEVAAGEVVGIIGRNGAGKSTLLKILSRITAPTTGRVQLWGRVGSLLEVGTGFHAELTGRENIYLNGSILGMKRQEINRKFDEIVDFSECGDFLDMPVKRYSSGMYVRLAFAVAAHLQPEILIVDEVLAVGDAQFQAKCLGKMEEVATHGRTVFLVSHQMNVVQRLCKTALLLDQGRLLAAGDKDDVIAKYLLSGPKALSPEDWYDLSEASRSGTGEARFTAVRYAVGNGKRSLFAQPDGTLEVEMEIESPIRQSLNALGVSVYDRFGTRLVHANSRDHHRPILLTSGMNRICIRIESLHLNPNTYTVGIAMESIEDLLDSIPAAFQLEVKDSAGEPTDKQRRTAGLVPCKCEVTVEEEPTAGHRVEYSVNGAGSHGEGAAATDARENSVRTCLQPVITEVTKPPQAAAGLNGQASQNGDLAFPVRLVCPSCGAPMAPDVPCPCPAATRLELWQGIPRVLFGQKYWGECSAEKMGEILKRMDGTHWKRALKEVTPNESVRRHLCSTIGPDFVHSMPWDEIDTVLDIGAGMGFMTAPLAAHAKQVVAVEAVPERALFQRKRAAQDGFAHWHPIIASATALPFAPESFDLITLNGVFEYVGLWGEGDPQAVQRRFLRQLHRLLKPNGYLYVGIETRYGLNVLLGGRDHSGLKFTSLMPRWMANWYCRLRKQNFYGSEHQVEGYRTYTYTVKQYARMFKEAGFDSVEIFGACDGYNRQKAVYPMGDAHARRVTRRIVDPPASWKGWLRRRIADARPWYQLIEDDVIVFGRKSRKPEPLVWNNLPHQGPITQFSTSDKVFIVGFTDDVPTALFKTAKTANARERLAKEYSILLGASHKYEPEAKQWRLRWPTPVSAQQRHGQTLYHYEFVQGTPLTRLFSRWFDADRFHRVLAQLMRDYVGLCTNLTVALPGRPSNTIWHDLLQGLAEVQIDDKKLSGRIREAFANLRRNKRPAHVVHGDLSLDNTLMVPGGGMVLVDWESASRGGVIAVDLLRLVYDIWHESAALKPSLRRPLMKRTKKLTCEILKPLGVGPEDFADIELMFVAHQCQVRLSRGDAEIDDILRAYHEGVFALTRDVAMPPRRKKSQVETKVGSKFELP